MDFRVIKELASLGGELIIVVLFLYYLSKKDELNEKTYDEFNQTIYNHLHQSNAVIDKNTKALKSVAVNLKELSVIIKNKKTS